MDNETGWKNCVKGLQQILPLAEKNGITVQMELLNSKLNHKDYMCDRTPWGVELCKRLGSPNFKLLYDIYHMQIDEGDVIQTIHDNHDYIGHYHTAGVPGRHEIDDTQELYYPAVIKAIVVKVTKAALDKMAEIAQGMVREALDAFVDRDETKAQHVIENDARLDASYADIFRVLLTYMMEDPRNITFCIHLMFAAKNIERMGDHATNIAETVYYMVEGRTIAEQRPKGDTLAALVSEH